MDEASSVQYTEQPEGLGVQLLNFFDEHKYELMLAAGYAPLIGVLWVLDNARNPVNMKGFSGYVSNPTAGVVIEGPLPLVLTLTPNTYALGSLTPLTAKGSGFVPFEFVTLSWDGQTLIDTVQAQPDGTFTVTETPTGLAPGPHFLEAVDQDVGQRIRATFTITGRHT